MRENRIRESLHEISMSGEKKEEVWDAVVKAADKKRRSLYKRVAAAAAVLVLLLIPVGIQAAGIFKWDWEAMYMKNEPLDMNFRQENGCVEGGGFRFCIEQAMCNEEIGLAYYYLSVTDISGKGRNPKDYRFDAERAEKGEVVYEIMSEGESSGREVYDSEHSTDTKAYFYIHNIGNPVERPGEEREGKMGNVQIEFYTVEKEDKLIVAARETIPIQNVVEMPVLLWTLPAQNKVKEDQEVTVWVSAVLAHVCNTAYDGTFEISLKDGTSILDCDEKGKNVSSDRVFTGRETGSEPIASYEYDYTDIDNIRGIWLGGEYYSAEMAERRMSK